MPRHNFAPLRGELRRLTVDARSLRTNRLEDPSERELLVYLPPGVDDVSALPLFVGLAAFTGSGLKLNNWSSFGETLPQRLERLISAGAMGPVLLVLPDAFTSLGGNQYVDSPVLGDWSQFLRMDLFEALEAEFGELAPPKRRAVFGHSSGGYGALMQGLRHAEAWGALACHSGDMGFEWLYRADFPKALRALAPFDGDVDAFLRSVAEAKAMRGDTFYALMSIAMAASYDPPAPGAAIRLPVDPHSCELDEAAWARWLAHDPVHLAASPEQLDPLRELDVFIDVGTKDEYNLLYGARRFCDALRTAGIEHTYEEFDDGHSKVAYRYDRSLPWLYEALTKP